MHSLDLTGVGSGSVTVNGTPQSLPWSGSFAWGTVVTLEAVPAAGWQFDNWSGDLAGSANPDTITMDADKSVTANFSQIFHTLDLTGVGTGSVTVDGTPRALPWSGSFAWGTVVTLEAVPAPGWQFDNWSGDQLLADHARAGPNWGRQWVGDGERDAAVAPLVWQLCVGHCGDTGGGAGGRVAVRQLVW
jgi:uncharacterized repeat protein (TIGR02543 family)